MDTSSLKFLRLTGIAGIIAALAWTAGDVLLLGAKASPAQYPILAQYANTSWVDMATAMIGLPYERLAAGALIAVFTTPLYLLSTWHLYHAIKPAGKWLALPPFVLLFVGYALAPFAHGSFFYLGETYQLLGSVDPATQPQVLAMADRFSNVLLIEYGTLAVITLVGFLWFTAALISGRARYPRWVALLNPIVLILIGSFSDQVLPEPISTLIAGAGLNVGMLMWFALSTILLWNGGRQALAASPADIRTAQPASAD